MKSQTTKQILVLANSIKKGGRCVAGIEITPTESDEWNLGDWIRPIDPTQHEGTIPIYRTIINNRYLRPLDCVAITFTKNANDPYHPEDYEIDTNSKWIREGTMGLDVFDELPDESGDLWGIASAGSRKVTPKRGGRTLRLIKPQGACRVEAFHDDTRWGPKFRTMLYLTHKGGRHAFSIDDPYFTDRHNLAPRKVGPSGIQFDLDPCRLVVVASLTKPFEKDGMQYKIAASIFEL